MSDKLDVFVLPKYDDSLKSSNIGNKPRYFRGPVKSKRLPINRKNKPIDVYSKCTRKYILFFVREKVTVDLFLHIFPLAGDEIKKAGNAVPRC